MDQTTIDLDYARIAEIDAMFERASCGGKSRWGSWMVEAANEREALVNLLQDAGCKIEHKYLARTVSGRKVD